MNEARKTELLEALTIVIESDEIAEECENANYHSALGFLEELRDILADTGRLGYAEDEEDE